jgi:aminoglycoside phosphotransferase (APT) family kinase protein
VDEAVSAGASARLNAWLSAQLPGDDDREPEISRIPGGTSNELYRITYRSRDLVLRRPPGVPQDKQASDRIMSREYRILRALDGTGIPHPRPLALCEDQSVLGVHFYLMTHVAGFSPLGPLPERFASSPEARRDWAFATVDTLADLASLDWRELGLEGFGKPEGFLDRQASRWQGHFRANRTRDVPGLAKAATWLSAHRPAPSAPGIMHGDYQPHNTLVAEDLPARLTAVLDWEQATIGDPLLDLGLLLAGWADPGEPPRFASYMSPRDGMPSRAELAARYAARSGRDVSGIGYYEILALFKLACVLEGNYRLWATGESTRDAHRLTGDIVLKLAAQAAEVVAAQP